MKAYFQRLFNFNQWANHAVVSFLNRENITDPKILRIASHLLLAQENWYKRVVGLQQDTPVWDVLTLSDLLTRLPLNDQQWAEYVQTLTESDFAKSLSYTNMAAEPQISELQDILAHVANHATYHRGQIVYLIRALGMAPPATDYIKFARM